MRRILVEVSDKSYQNFIDVVSKFPSNEVHLWEELNQDDFFFPRR